MKKLPFIIAPVLCAFLTLPASAGDYRSHHHRHYGHHDGYRHYRKHRHYRHHHHHHHYHERRRDWAAEYLVGGIVLGAALNELADGHERASTTTVTRTTTVYASPGTRVRSSSQYVGDEFLRAIDGRCYAVEYRSGDRILTEVHSDACVF